MATTNPTEGLLQQGHGNVSGQQLSRTGVVVYSNTQRHSSREEGNFLINNSSLSSSDKLFNKVPFSAYSKNVSELEKKLRVSYDWVSF